MYSVFFVFFYKNKCIMNHKLQIPDSCLLFSPLEVFGLTRTDKQKGSRCVDKSGPETTAHWSFRTLTCIFTQKDKRCLNKKQYQQQYQGLESVLFSQCCMEEVENEAPTPTWLWSKSMTPIQYTLAPNSLAFIAWESQEENLSHDSTDIQWIHVT